MSHQKAVYKYKDNEMKVEVKNCHPKSLPTEIKYLAPYWHQAFSNVLRYKKQRNLQEVHKIVDNIRIEKGLELYKKGYVKEITVTTAFQGDVNAVVLSEDKKTKYRLVMKNFLPEEGRLPQYNHEREQYLTDLLVTCSCDDHMIHRYSSNVSMLCKHCCAVIFFLIDKHNMIKIFITPEEKICGYKKSEIQEIETEIQSLPLVKFSQFINILLLKNYRGMKPSLGLSIHKISNTTHQEMGKPIWLTFTETKDIMRIMRGLSKVYFAMKPDTETVVFAKDSIRRNGTKKMMERQINEKTDVVLEREKLSLWDKIKKLFY